MADGRVRADGAGTGGARPPRPRRAAALYQLSYCGPSCTTATVLRARDARAWAAARLAAGWLLQHTSEQPTQPAGGKVAALHDDGRDATEAGGWILVRRAPRAARSQAAKASKGANGAAVGSSQTTPVRHSSREVGGRAAVSCLARPEAPTAWQEARGARGRQAQRAGAGETPKNMAGEEQHGETPHRRPREAGAGGREMQGEAAQDPPCTPEERGRHPTRRDRCDRREPGSGGRLERHGHGPGGEEPAKGWAWGGGHGGGGCEPPLCQGVASPPHLTYRWEPRAEAQRGGADTEGGRPSRATGMGRRGWEEEEEVAGSGPLCGPG